MMMGLCKHKDVFGKPGSGVHSYRVFDLAIVDVLGSVLIAVGINYYTGGFWWVLLLVFLSGIVLHRAFCVRTTVDKLLFP